MRDQVNELNRRKMRSYRGSEKYVFVSYAHKDDVIAKEIISILVSRGIRVWFDEGIDPGTEWAKNIADHLINCELFFALISKNYLESENCKDEISFARDNIEKRLLIYLEDIKLPADMQLRHGRTQNISWYSYTDRNEFSDLLFRTHGLEECAENRVLLTMEEMAGGGADAYSLRREKAEEKEKDIDSRNSGKTARADDFPTVRSEIIKYIPEGESLTDVQLNYLSAVVELLGKQEKIKLIDVARYMNKSTGTINSAIKRLQSKGILSVNDRYEIHLNRLITSESGKKHVEMGNGTREQAAGRIQPVILLQDTSGSMHETMGSVNRLLRRMFKRLRDVSEQTEEQFMVSVISFGSEAELIQPLANVNEIKIEEINLEAGGMTSTGEALLLAKDLIEKQLSPHADRPIVILITDGEPTDNWEYAVEQFVDYGRSSGTQRISIGINIDMNDRAFDVLRMFAGIDGKMYLTSNLKSLENHFLQITKEIVSQKITEKSIY